jgi:hypothetical protein
VKLIFCPKCQDVVKLAVSKIRTCDCGEAWGRYVDQLQAEIGGTAIPLGFANNGFGRALAARPRNGSGSSFDAFVIPHMCPTIKVQPHQPESQARPSAAEIMQWLEDMHTLHREVTAFYSVDSYTVAVTHDDAWISRSYQAPTLLLAYAECAKEWKNGYPINVPVGLKQNEGY